MLFSAPQDHGPKSWAAFDFYRFFTVPERIAAHALAATDPIAAEFLNTLENAIAGQALVMSNDPDLLAGMQYLQASPASAPVLTGARAAAILGS